VEHYEIAAYGTVRTWAHLLVYQEAEQLLRETLDEEKETDMKLNEIAEGINVEAAHGEAVEPSPEQAEVKWLERSKHLKERVRATGSR
jgi:Domain of unknown function (DUF892)